GNSQHLKIGTGQFVEAGSEIHYYAGSKVVIDAGIELTASGGGSFLKLDPSGVTLSGATIKMNSGGAAGTGSGVNVVAPQVPWAADQDKAGAKPKLALANTQLQLARKARQIGASRCPICEACRVGMCEVGAAR
ncbi:type VI secretion system tip protein VgrG, partial [Pseudomonas stutzeri]|nr:type VI secretion system tip protein VgrG [Stutzerimonas stutzeri]